MNNYACCLNLKALIGIFDEYLCKDNKNTIIFPMI